MNERTHFFIKIYLSLFILERVDVGCVWEMSWRRGLTATYWPQVLLTIAALFLILAGVAQTWVTEGRPKALCLPLALTSASCPQLSPTGSNCLGYIIVSQPPASAVLPHIYTGASLDWRLGRGSICYSNSRFVWKVLLSEIIWRLQV